MKGELIKTSPHMRYLGVIVDSKLNFKAHFDYIGDKMDKVTRALSRLMPNLRGPHEVKRRLYVNILTSVILYTPIWTDTLAVSMSSRRKFRQWQRAIAIRVCSAYRSVSFDAATLLAQLIPLELLAAKRASFGGLKTRSASVMFRPRSAEKFGLPKG